MRLTNIISAIHLQIGRKSPYFWGEVLILPGETVGWGAGAVGKVGLLGGFKDCPGIEV